MADIAYRHSPGIQADNHRIQAIEAPLSFAYQARGERARPVPGNLDLEGSHFRYHGLLRRAVPRVRASLPTGLALLIPQMLGQLRGQPALQRLLEQRRQQALATRHLHLASIKTLKQRIQRPRATKLLHRLTPTSASRNNIIIIHHASILSNKRRIHRQLNTPRSSSSCPPRVRARLRAGLALLIPQVLGKLSGKAALPGLLK